MTWRKRFLALALAERTTAASFQRSTAATSRQRSGEHCESEELERAPIKVADRHARRSARSRTARNPAEHGRPGLRRRLRICGFGHPDPKARRPPNLASTVSSFRSSCGWKC